MSGTKNILGLIAVSAFLLAGSCAAPMNDGNSLFDDGAANHPITVEPSFSAIQLPSSGAGLLPQDTQRFENFVAAYKSGSNGSISITAPEGPGATAAISYYGERLAALGVPRDRIIVSTRRGMDYRTVELGFIGYQAKVEPCVDWSKNLADTASNLVSPNFGCSNQHNIAAMVSDPRDLIGPRAEDPNVNMQRRATVFDKYAKGSITANEKNAMNSAAVSDVNKQ